MKININKQYILEEMTKNEKLFRIPIAGALGAATTSGVPAALDYVFSDSPENRVYSNEDLLIRAGVGAGIGASIGARNYFKK